MKYSLEALKETVGRHQAGRFEDKYHQNGKSDPNIQKSQKLMMSSESELAAESSQETRARLKMIHERLKQSKMERVSAENQEQKSDKSNFLDNIAIS